MQQIAFIGNFDIRKKPETRINRRLKILTLQSQINCHFRCAAFKIQASCTTARRAPGAELNDNYAIGQHRTDDAESIEYNGKHA